ncbi:MAG: type II secretion system protein GspD, partial [Planctomyces sp.]
TTTAPNGTQTTNQNIISRTAAPGFNYNNQPLGNNVAANPTRLGPQGLSNFGVGRVNGDLGFGGLVLSAGSESVNLLLRALDAQFNIDVLSRPQIRAVENHQAFIQIGQQVPVVDGVSVTPVGSANPVIRQDQAGIILKVTPRISPDGRVQLDVNAEKSAFNLAPGTGVPIFTDATNGNVIEAPIKDITTADTTVSVQSGQTIVLGGMITNDQTNV